MKRKFIVFRENSQLHYTVLLRQWNERSVYICASVHVMKNLIAPAAYNEVL